LFLIFQNKELKQRITDGLGIEDLKKKPRFLLLVVLVYQAALQSRKKMAANDIAVLANAVSGTNAMHKVGF
jgi:hypothetical protein